MRKNNRISSLRKNYVIFWVYRQISGMRFKLTSALRLWIQERCSFHFNECLFARSVCQFKNRIRLRSVMWWHKSSRKCCHGNYLTFRRLGTTELLLIRFYDHAANWHNWPELTFDMSLMSITLSDSMFD